MVPAAVDYAEELSERGAGDVELLRAHDYVRYLRDLSGGQALRTLVHRHYDAPEAGLHFRRFPGAERINSYDDHYRTALGHVPLVAPGQARVLIRETTRAFELNRRVFADPAASTDPVGVGA